MFSPRRHGGTTPSISRACNVLSCSCLNHCWSRLSITSLSEAGVSYQGLQSGIPATKFCAH